MRVAAALASALKQRGVSEGGTVEVEGEVDDAPAGKSLGEVSLETFLAHGDPRFVWQLPADEWNAIALNCTRGTTGSPKVVVTHPRGVQLSAVTTVVTQEMPRHAECLPGAAAHPMQQTLAVLCPADPAAGAVRWPFDGRDFLSGSSGDEGLSEERDSG